jgi:hypothetical protein
MCAYVPRPHSGTYFYVCIKYAHIKCVRMCLVFSLAHMHLYLGTWRRAHGAIETRNPKPETLHPAHDPKPGGGDSWCP